ncbi:hypothetical protein [Serratia marcescens]|uniref:hypothetical protein n=1 Tax=Serratia marcescens TaxID=615 RepID=UPI0013277877|nr:hypothetical protein [Serratia marcescens]MXS94424.1 hypothetical protein [Serratia marcescens]QHJ25335.1 hypothetical protein GV243_05810 [Serratia marcescens]
MSTEKLIELSKPVAQAYYDEHDSSTMLIDWLVDSVPEAPTALYSQEYVSALLAELEASKKSNAFLKEQLAKLANFNPDWDMLEACRESWREVAAALKEAEARLAANDKRIVALERINKAQEDHINQQQDRIESLEKKNGDLGHGLQAAEKRIAGLVERLATPVRLLGEMPVHDWEHRVERQAAFEHRKIAWDARLAEDKKAILAAGFTFTVEGDE